jgi:hypothetical protein
MRQRKSWISLPLLTNPLTHHGTYPHASLNPNYIPKAPTPNTSTIRISGLGFQHMNLDDAMFRSWISPKLSCVESLVPSGRLWCYWEVVDLFRSEVLWKKVRSWGSCPWKGYWDPNPSLSLFASWPPWGEQVSPSSVPAMIHCAAKARRPSDHGLKLLKPWAKMNLFPY